MSISLKTHKMLWGRSGSRCAMPDCRRALVVDETETDDPSVVGEEAHIVARSEDGPRGKSDLPLDSRDNYDNLILLCNIHHKQIDDQVNTYTVEVLREMKSNHVEWVKSNLVTDVAKQKDDEVYATYIQKIVDLAHISNWNAWTSWLLGSSCSIDKNIYEDIVKLPEYIISRVWPKRYQELEDAIFNVKAVMVDLLKVFAEYSDEKENSNVIRTERFYKIREWDEERYNYLLKKYEYHIDLIDDLTIELTRAFNFLFDKVRQYIFSGYRMEEGHLLITRGPDMSMSYHTFKIEYKADERTSAPYPGLKKFMEIRTQRDLSYGKGVEESYFPPNLY